MSNRIDFYQAEQSRFSQPAAKVSVFFEEVLCPYLELIEIVRCGWPEFGWVRFGSEYGRLPAGRPDGC